MWNEWLEELVEHRQSYFGVLYTDIIDEDNSESGVDGGPEPDEDDSKQGIIGYDWFTKRLIIDKSSELTTQSPIGFPVNGIMISTINVLSEAVHVFYLSTI